MRDVEHTERPRALSLLREMVLNEYVRPNKEQMAQGAARVEQRAARQMGIHAEYNDETLEQRGEIAVGDLESSLDEWIKYLSDPNEPCPTWFRYYAFRNILNHGEYDKDKQEFPKRSKGTFKLFPDIDRGALAYVEEIMAAAQDDTVLARVRESQKEFGTPEADMWTPQKAQDFVKMSFAKQYAKGIETQGTITPELRAETRGEWVHYHQGHNPKGLWKSLQNKGENEEAFTKTDLILLYEINGTIEGFGYQKDPRINELRQGRNAEEDMLVIFECTREEIAHVPSQINENTKAYVGQLEPGIFQRLLENIEHVYTSFPDKKIRRENIDIGGKSAEQLISEMEAASINISDYAKSMLKNREFVPGKNPEEATLIRLTVADLGFKNSATTDQINERAQILGLELCRADTSPTNRL